MARVERMKENIREESRETMRLGAKMTRRYALREKRGDRRVSRTR